MASSSSTSPEPDAASICEALLDADDEQQAPFLYQYDPIHEATVAISTPGPSDCQLGPSLAPLGASALFGAEAPRTLRAVAQASAQPCPGIDYQDFAPEIEGLDVSVPRCKQSFCDLVQRANRWLNQNPHMRVRTCETVTWCTNQLKNLGDTESVVTHRGYHSSSPLLNNFILIGLRLWVRISEDNSPPQVLHYRDFTSQSSQSLADLVAAANVAMRRDKTTGELISAQTLLAPHEISWETSSVFWQESFRAPAEKHTVFLRMFYSLCTKRLPSLGIKHIVPDVVNGYYESFSRLMQRASEWITQQRNVCLLNMKSSHINKTEHENGVQCCEHLSQHWSQYHREQYIQVLTIFFSISSHSSSKQQPISCMTFTPVQTTLGPNTTAQFEKLKQTMIRITAWLELADADVRSMETLISPCVSTSPNHTLPEVMFWTPSLFPSPHVDPTPFLFHFRVYLEGEYIEPDLRLLPPLPHSLSAAQTCCLHESHPTGELRTRHKRKIRLKVLQTVVIANVFLLVIGLIVFTLFYFNHTG